MPSYILPIYSFILIYLYKYIFQGLNYLLIPIRPAEGSGLTVAYDIMNAVFSSFQVITTILTLNLSMFCIVYVSIFCVTWIPFGSHLLRLNIFKTWNLQNMKYFLQGGCCVAAFVLHKLWGSIAFANEDDPVHGQQQHQLHPPHPRQQQERPSPRVGLGQLDEHPHPHGGYQHNLNRTRK